MKRLIGVLVVTAAAVVPLMKFDVRAQSNAPKPAAPSTEWPTYGHDSGGMRYSPVTQITPANVGQLQVAWVYHMRPAPSARPGRRHAAAAAPAPGRGRGRGGSGFAASETTPIVVNGVMYISTPYGRVVALDPTTGKEVWVFQVPAGNPSTRGVEYWAGDARTPPQIIFGTGGGRLYSLDAKTGQPTETFGDRGSIDMNTPEILQGMSGSVGLSSPPTVYKNLIITGSRNQENPPRGPLGDVRAWDVHSGKLVWTFRSVPQAGEKFNDTWAGDSWKNRSGVNVWGFITVDVERGIVYMPFGAPSVDQYGGDRAGDNLFGTSIVAADANTGKYLWHFQVVHHDIWDADLSAAPALIDVKQGGKTIPAVAVDQQARTAVPARPRDGQTDLRRRRTTRAAERGAARAPVEDTAVSAQAAAALAHVVHAGRHRDRDARARGRVPEDPRRPADSAAPIFRRATSACACSFQAITAA